MNGKTTSIIRINMSRRNAGLTKMSKPRGKPFQPGNKFGTGRPALPDDLRILMRSTGEQMKRVMCEVISMSVGEMQTVDGNPPKDCNVFRAALISSLNNTLQTGDDRSIRLIMDRILGKVQESESSPLDEQQDHSKDSVIQDLVKLIVDKKE
jgi:hypothetical protein